MDKFKDFLEEANITNGVKVIYKLKEVNENFAKLKFAITLAKEALASTDELTRTAIAPVWKDRLEDIKEEVKKWQV